MARQLIRIVFLLVCWTAPGVTWAQPVIEAGTAGSVVLPGNRVSLRAPAGATQTSWRLLTTAGPAALSAQQGGEVRLAMLVPGDYVVESSSVGGAAPATRTTRVTLQASAWIPTASATALDHLSNSLAPVHRQGHTLAPLAGMIEHHFPMARQLADRWGFGLQVAVNPGFCEVNPGGDGGNLNQVLGAAVASNGRYPLVVGMANILPGYGNSSANWVGSAPASVWLRDLAGNLLPNAERPRMSPVAPEAWVRGAARSHAECIGRITAAYPAALITSGGEYGVDVAGFAWCNLLIDPNVLAAAGFPVIPGGSDPRDPSCFQNPAFSNGVRDYGILRLLSRSKMRHERIIREEVDARARWSSAGPQYSLYGDAFGPERNRWNGWSSWMFYVEDGITAGGVSTMGSPEFYFGYTNQGWSGRNSLGDPQDIMTTMLNNAGGSIRAGRPLTYGWVSAGWGGGGPVADRERWMGFTKMLFTAGMVGAANGYFDYTDAYVNQVVRGAATGPTLPLWLWQYIDLGQAHGLFSYLDVYLRDGDLVRGSGNHPYRYGGDDSPTVPWYGLTVTGNTNANGPTAYALARKRRGADRWIVATFANVGSSRDIQVQLPGAGSLTLLTRPAGAVYLVELNGAGQPVTRLIDTDPMQPTALLFPDQSLDAGAATALMADGFEARP
jgi:hypothetical protein